jgi:hypothetical protein
MRIDLKCCSPANCVNGGHQSRHVFLCYDRIWRAGETRPPDDVDSGKIALPLFYPIILLFRVIDICCLYPCAIKMLGILQPHDRMLVEGWVFDFCRKSSRPLNHGLLRLDLVSCHGAGTKLANSVCTEVDWKREAYFSARVLGRLNSPSSTDVIVCAGLDNRHELMWSAVTLTWLQGRLSLFSVWR